MSQRLIGSYFQPQKANDKSQEKGLNSNLKRPLEIFGSEDDDGDDSMFVPTKKARKAIIESDGEDATTAKASDGTQESPVQPNDVEFLSSCGDNKIKVLIPLRKTAKRKPKNVNENVKDMINSKIPATPQATGDKSIEQASVKVKSPVKMEIPMKNVEPIESTREEVKDLFEDKKPIHNFFDPKKAQFLSKRSTDSKDNEAERKITSEGEVMLNALKPGNTDDTRYNPASEDYDSINDACWSEGEKVPYIALAKTFEEIEKVSARLKSIEILSNFLQSVIVLSPSDLVPCVYLCLNKLAPAYEGIELGIGENLLMKAISQATGRSMDRIKADVEEKGDLGLVAEMSRSTQRTMFSMSKLTVASVFKNLKEVALMSGHSSMSKKSDKIKSMFVSCRGPEARYLIRSLGGKLRIGMAELSVLQSIAQAFVLVQDHRKLASEALKKKVEEAALIIKTCYCECPNYDKILPILLNHPLNELSQHCKITPGIPIQPMLAHPTKGIHEVMSKFESSEFVCEFKYDGERAQIHLLEGGQVMIFSRNQENNTSKYPDVTSRIAACTNPDENVTSAIIDAEAVAWDSTNKQILPFQVLSTRKRKDANSKDIKVQVCIYAFDLLFLNGESLVKSPLRYRRELLQKAFMEVEGEFMFAKSMVSNNTEDVSEFLEDSIKGSCEGLMVKTLDKEATYEIAKRSRNWLKLKKDYLDGVGDTVDLVVIGGFHGTGKRTGKFGGFLLACFDAENEEYQTICKIGTGFTDADLDQHAQFLRNHIINKPKNYYRFDPSHCPDKWFDAVQVWEVKAADLSLSPVHQAALGLVDPNKGISLRFPRFLRVRDDKKPEEATSSSQIASMYKSQDQIVSQAKGKESDDDQFF